MSAPVTARTTAPIKKLKQVQFGLMGPEELRELSVCEIRFSSLYDEAGKPVKQGLLDLRMGTTERFLDCESCRCSSKECPGHFGHIVLAQPVYHIGLINQVLKLLRCVCFHCGKLLLDPSKDAGDVAAAKRERNPKKRFQMMYGICANKKQCISDPDDGQAVSRCGNYQPSFRRHQIGIKGEYGKEVELEDGMDKKFDVTAQKVLEVFKKVSDDDCRLLGFDPRFARPDWMILTLMPVAPPAVRPSVAFGASRSSDDLTYKYSDIVKTNNRLQRMVDDGAPAFDVKEKTELLQFHVATLMDNEIAGIPPATQRGGRPIKSVRQRLVGKGGRVRGNLSGKRVDFSARTVITADPNLSIDEVGVPTSIAMNLTFPERVTSWNLPLMRKLVENGPDIHPGAKNIIRSDGTRVDLAFAEDGGMDHLEPGFIVERHIADGDPVLFNRQPSLHKMSIMAHKVRVLPYSTFRLNLSCTSPYNADFDGDEMNLHVPQTYTTRAEALQLMLVPIQIVSPQSNKPVIGIVQDTLLGCSLFTRRDTFMTRDEVFNVLMHVETWDGQIPAPAILKPEPLWTGKQIFTLLIPEINVERFSKTHSDSDTGLISPADTRVVIHDGVLLAGIMDKMTLGTSAGSLVHVIWHEHGPMATRDFLNSVQKVVNHWLVNHGFSVGIGDTVAEEHTLKEIEDIITNAKTEVANLTTQARDGTLERQPGRSEIESFEAAVNKALNEATNLAGKAVGNGLHSSNRINAMVNAGSKGSPINLSQIIACVGQQNVAGERIRSGFTERALPHFNKGDVSPEGRGFVQNSYLQGLTPQEFFFHAMGGREGLVDTAVKTAETGYIQRRLIKAMDDIRVHYDGSVRNSLGHVIQFLYGEDGMDAVFIEKQRLDSVKMDNEQFDRTYKIDLLNGKDLDTFLTPAVKDAIQKSPNDQKKLSDEYNRLKKDRNLLRNKIVVQGDDKIHLPVNVRRLISNAQRMEASKSHHKSDMNPVEVIDMMSDLFKELVVVIGTDTVSEAMRENSTTLFKILLRSTLASKRVLKEFRLSRDSFTWLLGEIKVRFARAVVHAGESVGAIAAQSIGEPATQMTLNTFHFAGVSAKNVTLGVPRLNEIINISTNPKTPSLTVYLKMADDEKRAKEVLNSLEYLCLRDITETTEIVYDPDPKNSVIEEDREWLDMLFEVPDENIDDKIERCLPWMVRIVLNRDKKEDKGVTNQQVAERIQEEFGDDLFVLHVPSDNSAKLVLQVRLVVDDDNADEMGLEVFQDVTEDEELARRVEKTLMGDNVKLCGVRGIKKVFMRHEKTSSYNKATGKLEEQEPWVLDTEGVNLQDVMAVESIDYSKTVSNHVTEILECLGIEATRAAILNELRAVISFDGAYVNYRHLATLVDVMTHKGELMAVTRHGINRLETDPLQRCSFEETVEILYEAAMFSETDGLLGATENVLVGRMAPCGTGSFELVVDQDLLEEKAPTGGTIGGAGEEEWDLSTGAFGTTPMQGVTPMVTPGHDMGGFSNQVTGGFSPIVGDGHMGGASPGYSASSPSSPFYGSPTSPAYEVSPTSPAYGVSPESPSYSPTSPAASYSPSSPGYSPSSPGYSPSSPAAGYSPSSPAYSPTSPAAGYSPTSPAYSPTSPSAGYSPTSPAYSPTSPAAGYSPTSPAYSPTSPAAGYSPTSPAYSPTSPNAAYSPTSPAYSPTSPNAAAYSPESPAYKQEEEEEEEEEEGKTQ